jgi:hypothetical protein
VEVDLIMVQVGKICCSAGIGVYGGGGGFTQVLAHLLVIEQGWICIIM